MGKMKIIVTGTGYVGLVAGVCFAEKGYDVTCVDVDEEKIEKLSNGISTIYEEGLEELLKKNIKKGNLHFTINYKDAYKDADVIFIGVGTPEGKDGAANLFYVETVSRQIAETIEKDCLVVVNSTVPVGTNDKVETFIKENLVNNVKVEVASNPEFLSQGHAVRDTFEAKRIIIGTNSQKAEKFLKKIYEPFNLPIVSVSRRSAEMIKYACNNFLALKISYMNDIANLCELVGADINEVATGMSYDNRIGADFLRAGIGYGGSCFPKDTKALMYLAKQNNYTLRTIQSAIEINEEQKIKLYKKACERLNTFEGLKVAILGVAFKVGTDDLREAPALINIDLLLERGANIYVYDPVAIKNLKKRYSTRIHYATNIEEAIKDANVCFIFTEWEQIKKFKPRKYKELMKMPIIYDGRNIYDTKEMKKNEIEYYSIGR